MDTLFWEEAEVNHYETNSLAYVSRYFLGSLHPGRFRAHYHTTGRYPYPTPFTNEHCHRYTHCPGNSNPYIRA